MKDYSEDSIMYLIFEQKYVFYRIHVFSEHFPKTITDWVEIRSGSRKSHKK